MNSDAPGGRPAEVALATKCLVTNLGLALFGAALLIDFYTAYLLLQPESAEWFRR